MTKSTKAKRRTTFWRIAAVIALPIFLYLLCLLVVTWPLAARMLGMPMHPSLSDIRRDTGFTFGNDARLLASQQTGFIGYILYAKISVSDKGAMAFRQSIPPRDRARAFHGNAKPDAPRWWRAPSRSERLSVMYQDKRFMVSYVEAAISPPNNGRRVIYLYWNAD
jgi:hypothetical protein